MTKTAKSKNHKTDLVKDFVCGMVKPKKEMKAKAVFKGKKYYFCTETDKQMFIAYPEHWLPKTNSTELKYPKEI